VDQVGSDADDAEVENDRLASQLVTAPRQGWAEAFAADLPPELSEETWTGWMPRWPMTPGDAVRDVNVWPDGAAAALRAARALI
jgi:hypothetical protein